MAEIILSMIFEKWNVRPFCFIRERTPVRYNRFCAKISEERVFSQQTCVQEREILRRAVRREKQQARRNFTQQEHKERSERVVQRILASPEFRRAETILIYSAVRGEVSLRTLPEAPEAAEKCFAYPRCGDFGTMDALVPSDKNAWQRGAYGIWEPDPARSVLVSPEEIDLVVCPCVAFDESGARMGMGGGYYDRYLPHCIHADIACVAFEIQKASKLPTEEWDCYMEIIFTDEATYRPSGDVSLKI